MILYFTGTGNSKYVADYLGDYLNDEVISIKQCMDEKKFTFKSEKPYIIVAPVYCYRVPIIVENFLKDANFLGSNIVYGVATMQSQTGKSGYFLKKIFETKGMEFKGFTGIRMPNNYLVSSPMVSEDEAKYIIRNASGPLSRLASNIQELKKIKKDDISPLPWTCSVLINPLFYRFNPKFNVNEDCIHCGKCIKDCPTHNIQEINGTITFGKDCTQCFSCIHRCPKQAINIKNKTQDRGRYICPSYPLNK